MKKTTDQYPTERMAGLSRSETWTIKSKWADRFLVSGVIQGLLAFAVTAFLLYDGVYDTPGAARVVASGGPGTWLTAGYLAFIIFGPIAATVTSLFYQNIETFRGAPYKGLSSLLAWGHIVLMNVGVVGATWIMIYGGLRGGNLALTLSPSNPSAAYGQVHAQVLAPLPPYIAAFVAIALLGALAGGVGYLLAWRKSARLSASLPK